MAIGDWLVKRISALTRTATDADLTDSEYMAVDNASAYTRRITVASLAAWILGRIKSLATSITSFRTGDVIPVDGPNGPAKMSKDDLLTETAQNTFVGYVSSTFDPTRTSDNPYPIYSFVVKDGLIYMFVAPHYGAWVNSDVTPVNESDAMWFYALTKLIGDVGQSVKLDLSWKKGYRIGHTGMAEADVNRCITDYIPVIPGMVIDGNTRTGETGYFAFYFRKSEGGFVSAVSQNPRGYVVPAGAYFMRVTHKPSYTALPDTYLTIQSVSNESLNGKIGIIENIIGNELDISDLVLSNSTVNPDGSAAPQPIRVSNAGHAVEVSGSMYVDVEVASGYKFLWYSWDGVNSVVMESGWITGSARLYVADAKYIFINFGKVDDSNISVAEVTSNCTFSKKNGINSIKESLDVLGKTISFNEFYLRVGTVGNDGSLENTSIRVSSAEYPVNVEGSYYIKYHCNEGYKVHISEALSNGSVAFKSGFINGDGVYRLNGYPKLYVIFGRNDNGVVSVSEITANCSVEVVGNIKGNRDFIAQECGPYIPASQAVPYYGEKISFKNGFIFKKLFTLPSWQNSQGGAIYGKYLVSVMACDEMAAGVTNGHIYDLETKTKVCDLSFGSTLNGTTYSLPHANCVCFGKEKYNASSDFPLLYVSQVNGGSSALWSASERGVLVYDLQKQLDDSYVPVLVQVIRPDLSTEAKIDEIEAKIGKYTPNYVVDVENSKLVILGYPAADWFIGYEGGMPVAIMDLPPKSSSEVVFGASDIEDSYRILMSFAIQQPLLHNGKVYIQGGTSYSSRGIQVLDLSRHERVSLVVTTNAHAGEPQFIGLYDGKCLWYDAGTSGDIYEVVFS